MSGLVGNSRRQVLSCRGSYLFQYLVLEFMILSALLIWFLSTETLGNVSLLENH